MNKLDQEYLDLLRLHLKKAYDELRELRKKTDKKIVEINEIEELIEAIERNQ